MRIPSWNCGGRAAGCPCLALIARATEMRGERKEGRAKAAQALHTILGRIAHQKEKERKEQERKEKREKKKRGKLCWIKRPVDTGALQPRKRQ